ncbi:hypothetical protein VN12_17025 [Pirellula sp. SH-Sr6A]|uniref:hypothetical protein n=1 Tax=Pirellula sp. SH-Sr6A TaxID=1632865 RepID=UPI00078CA9A2|nr:hypothetical protein [Pirellula sp. SH-Sr6A]AMV33834.1 hypothetical protein VN12_17025 [Pirellula sp. SH-Sr6A]
MRTKIANWNKLALVVLIVGGTQVGCKSGWKMPGASMFSWSKKPSESTLAGSNPSISSPSAASMGSGLAASGAPTSPALRNTPNMLASTAKTSPYGTPTGMAGSAGPVAGGAAASNGYQTGPYVTSTGNRPTGFTAPTGYGPTGAPTGVPTGAPTGSFAMNGAPAGAPSGFGLPGAGSNGMAPPPSSPTLATASAYGAPQPTAPYGMPSAPAGVPALPVGMSSTNMASLPAGMPAGTMSSMPNAAPASYTPQQNAAPIYAGAAPYRPGSTARQTSYDFSQPSATGAPNTGLPGVNVPQTATGLPQPNNLYR